MLQKILLSLSCVLLLQTAFAQKKWFSFYTDSAALVKKGTSISQQFMKDVRALKPDLAMQPKVILHTTPYLIYYDLKEQRVNLPLWNQMPKELVSFFTEMAGTEQKGRQMFALFFNGFYLPHELGHGFQHLVAKAKLGYEGEYFANTVAVLWWRKHHQKKQLKQCYELAKNIMTKLTNPVPAGQTMQQYYSENYEKASENPYVYGYMQFGQLVQIYKDKSLPDFDTFIQNYLKVQKL